MEQPIDKTEGKLDFIFKYNDLLSEYNTHLMNSQKDLLQSFLALRIKCNEQENRIKELEKHHG